MSQSIDVVLNQRSCMMVVLRIIEENIPEVRRGGGVVLPHCPPPPPGGPTDLPPPRGVPLTACICAAAVPQPEQQQTLPLGRPLGAGPESCWPEDPRPLAQRGESRRGHPPPSIGVSGLEEASEVTEPTPNPLPP